MTFSNTAMIYTDFKNYNCPVKCGISVFGWFINPYYIYVGHFSVTIKICMSLFHNLSRLQYFFFAMLNLRRLRKKLPVCIFELMILIYVCTWNHTVISCLEAKWTHSLPKCFWRISSVFLQNWIVQWYFNYINSPFVISVLVESSRCSSKTLWNRLCLLHF